MFGHIGHNGFLIPVWCNKKAIKLKMVKIMKKSIENKQIAAKTKEANVPFLLNEEALHGLVFRIAGQKYADHIRFSQVKPIKPGMDRFVLSDQGDGKILIEATSGVAAANGFRWYIENRCDSYVGPLNRRLNFPANPPAIGETYKSESLCLYRYFLNYCTYGYTFAFWQWDKWEETIDWMMLAGYNLILNPIGAESVWLAALQKLGYTIEQARAFICSPTVFPWQCMNNISGWAGSASMNYYLKRLELAKKINARIRSFGAEIVAPGWSGMVPQDFQEHYPESKPIHQGLWCGMPRPSILLQDDKAFATVGYYYYKTLKELLGTFCYFSTDPFHEGGDSSGVDLQAYAQACLRAMQEFSPNAVWFLQGWGDNPLRQILRALPVGNVLIGDLLSEYHKMTDNFADYPWLYGTVDNFGGRRSLRGSLNYLVTDPIPYLQNEDLTVVGFAMFPEGLDTDEMMFDAVADYAVCSVPQEHDAWLKKRLRIRYGVDSENAFEGWKLISEYIYTATEHRDSGLLSRPSLSVANVICQQFAPTYDLKILEKAVHLLFTDYDKLCHSDAYRMDLMDAARQAVANAAWTPIKGIQDNFFLKNEAAFEENLNLLMHYYDLQQAVTASDKHTMLGPWLEMARAEGDTPAEKAYMEFLARTILTLWGDREGSPELHDYACREWSGLLDDFYRPRWESYINILRCSLVTGNRPMDYNRYDVEYFFTTLSKSYPVEPTTDLKQAVAAILQAFPL